MPHQDQQRPTLNPFAFPPETNGRFNMLVLGVLMIAIHTSILFVVFGTFVLDPYLVYDFQLMVFSRDFLNSVTGDRRLISLPDEDAERIAIEMQRLSFAMLKSGLPRHGMTLLYLLTIVGGTYLVYHLHPWIIQRVQRLRPLRTFPNDEYASDLECRIGQIAASVGVAPPQVLIRKRAQSGGQVFGLRNRYLLRLNAWPWPGLDELSDLWRRSKQHDEFSALVLHELGHIANHDLGRSNFVLALRRVYIVLVIIPWVAVSFWIWSLRFADDLQPFYQQTDDILWVAPQLFDMMARIIALVLIMGASYAALLRVREFYADWRTQLWGAGAALRQGLQKKRVVERQPCQGMLARLPQPIRHAAAKIGSWWKNHSSAEERLKQLNNPQSLFSVSSELAFQTGVLLAFVQVGVPIVFIYLFMTFSSLSDTIGWALISVIVDWPEPFDDLLYRWITLYVRGSSQVVLLLGISFSSAYLVSKSLGQQVMRATIADLAVGRGGLRPYLKLWRPALFLAIGQEVGFLSMPWAAFTVHDTISLTLIPALALIFTALTWIWLVYLRTLSQLMIGTYVGTSPPQLKRWIVSASAAISLWAIYLPILPARVLFTLAETLSNLPDEIFALILERETFMGVALLMMGVLVMVSLFCFGFFSAISLSATWSWSATRRPRCPSCRERIVGTIAAGRRCPACYGQLAAWLYITPRKTV